MVRTFGGVDRTEFADKDRNPVFALELNDLFHGDPQLLFIPVNPVDLAGIPPFEFAEDSLMGIRMRGIVMRRIDDVRPLNRCEFHFPGDDDRSIGINPADRLRRTALDLQIIDRKLRRLLRFVDEVIPPDGFAAFAVAGDQFPHLHIIVRERGIALHFKRRIVPPPSRRKAVTEDQPDPVLLRKRRDPVKILQPFFNPFPEFRQILSVEHPRVGGNPVADDIHVPGTERLQVVFGQRIR